MHRLIVGSPYADRPTGYPAGYELCHSERHSNYQHLRTEAMRPVNEGEFPSLRRAYAFQPCALDSSARLRAQPQAKDMISSCSAWVKRVHVLPANTR
jgi:hypothetical protein